MAENQEDCVRDLLGNLRLLRGFSFGFKNTCMFHRSGWFTYGGEFTKAAWLQLSVIFTCTALYMYIQAGTHVCGHCSSYHVLSAVERSSQRACCSWAVGWLDG